MKKDFLSQFNYIHRKKSIRSFINRIYRGFKNRFVTEPSIFLNTSPRFKNFDIGDYTYGSPDGSPILVHTSKDGKLTIGKFCSIAYNVIIFLGGSNHRPDWVSTYPFAAFFEEASQFDGYPKERIDVVIGNDVWIGEGVTIMSGITIGSGAVIATKSVVTKDVPPYAIVAGNPAKILRKRFDDGTIEKLLEIQWWNRDINYILKNIHLVLNDNPSLLIQGFEK